MTGKRKRYSAAFKAKAALEAIRGELTMAQLVTKHGVHQTLISAWKRQAVDGMAGVFSAKAEVAEAVREGELEKLHAKIGQLVVERDFLRKASGPVLAAAWSGPLGPDRNQVAVLTVGRVWCASNCSGLR
jgi:transposase